MILELADTSKMNRKQLINEVEELEQLNQNLLDEIERLHMQLHEADPSRAKRIRENACKFAFNIA
jgi:hypothetical protein